MEDFIKRHTFRGQHDLDHAAIDLQKRFKQRTGQHVPIRVVRGILRSRYKTWLNTNGILVVGCSI